MIQGLQNNSCLTATFPRPFILRVHAEITSHFPAYATSCIKEAVDYEMAKHSRFTSLTLTRKMGVYYSLFPKIKPLFLSQNQRAKASGLAAFSLDICRKTAKIGCLSKAKEGHPSFNLCPISGFTS